LSQRLRMGSILTILWH